MIHVVAEIQVVARAMERFLKEFRRLVPLVRAEDGCLEYGGAVDLESGLAAAARPRPDLVTVVEKWRDVSALEAHLAAPHMVEHRGRVAGLVRETVIHVLHPAGDTG